jgi:hypothetical protein
MEWTADTGSANRASLIELAIRLAVFVGDGRALLHTCEFYSRNASQLGDQAATDRR